MVNAQPDAPGSRLPIPGGVVREAPRGSHSPHGKSNVSRTIAAPLEKVFGVVADIEAYPDVFPSVARIGSIGEQRSGVGTRFAETRFASG